MLLTRVVIRWRGSAMETGALETPSADVRLELLPQQNHQPGALVSSELVLPRQTFREIANPLALMQRVQVAMVALQPFLPEDVPELLEPARLLFGALALQIGEIGRRRGVLGQQPAAPVLLQVDHLPIRQHLDQLTLRVGIEVQHLPKVRVHPDNLGALLRPQLLAGPRIAEPLLHLGALAGMLLFRNVAADILPGLARLGTGAKNSPDSLPGRTARRRRGPWGCVCHDYHPLVRLHLTDGVQTTWVERIIVPVKREGVQMNSARLGPFLVAVTAAVPLMVALAQGQKEPLEGTWLLDVHKSNFTPQPGPKGQMRTYSLADGLEKMTSRGINGQGKSTLVHYEARYDGKDYDMVGSLGGNRISLKRIDKLTTQSTEKREGKPVIVATRRVSADEKTLTVETKGTLPDGRLLQATMVFQRQ